MKLLKLIWGKIMDYIQLGLPRKSNRPTSSFCIISCPRDYKQVDDILESLKLQTEAPEEVIIVSSGIKEADVKTVKYLEICDKHVPVIHVNSEKGFFAGKARNLCADYSSCDILIYIDGDDIPHPQKIEATKSVFIEKEIMSVLGWEETDEVAMVTHSFTGKKNNLPTFDQLNHADLYRISSLKQNTWLEAPSDRPVAHGPVAILRRLVTTDEPECLRWQPDQERAQDTAFCRQVFIKGHNIIHIRKPLIYYSNGPDSF